MNTRIYFHFILSPPQSQYLIFNSFYHVYYSHVDHMCTTDSPYSVVSLFKFHHLYTYKLSPNFTRVNKLLMSVIPMWHTTMSAMLYKMVGSELICHHNRYTWTPNFMQSSILCSSQLLCPPLTEGTILILFWCFSDGLKMGMSHEAFLRPCQLKQGNRKERVLSNEHMKASQSPSLQSITLQIMWPFPFRQCICLTFQGRCTMVLEKCTVEYRDWCLGKVEQGSTIFNHFPVHAIVQASGG